MLSRSDVSFSPYGSPYPIFSGYSARSASNDHHPHTAGSNFSRTFVHNHAHQRYTDAGILAPDVKRASLQKLLSDKYAQYVDVHYAIANLLEKLSANQELPSTAESRQRLNALCRLRDTIWPQIDEIEHLLDKPPTSKAPEADKPKELDTFSNVVPINGYRHSARPTSETGRPVADLLDHAFLRSDVGKYAAGKIPSAITYGLANTSSAGFGIFESTIGVAQNAVQLRQNAKHRKQALADLAQHRQQRNQLAAVTGRQSLIAQHLTSAADAPYADPHQLECLEQINQNLAVSKARTLNSLAGNEAKYLVASEKLAKAADSSPINRIKLARYCGSGIANILGLSSFLLHESAKWLTNTIAAAIAAPMGFLASAIALNSFSYHQHSYQKARQTYFLLDQQQKLYANHEELSLIIACLKSKQPVKAHSVLALSSLADAIGYSLLGVGGTLVLLNHLGVAIGALMLIAPIALWGGLFISAAAAAVGLGVGIAKGIQWLRCKARKDRAFKQLNEDPLQLSREARKILTRHSGEYALSQLLSMLKAEQGQRYTAPRPATEFCLKFMDCRSLNAALHANEPNDAIQLLRSSFNIGYKEKVERYSK